MISFLKEESGGLLLNCWNLVRLVGAAIGIHAISGISAVTSPNAFKVLQHGESCRDSTTRPWSFLEAEFPLDTRVTPVVVSYNRALSPLITLETAQQERSMLLLSEKRLLFKG
jgi:hypothetical protein